MSALDTLLREVGCERAPIRAVPTERERLGQIVQCCSNLVGYLSTHGITSRVFDHGRDIARLAERELSPSLSAGFAPLARLEQTLAEQPHWRFADMAAHVSHIAREATKGADV